MFSFLNLLLYSTRQAVKHEEMLKLFGPRHVISQIIWQGCLPVFASSPAQLSSASHLSKRLPCPTKSTSPSRPACRETTTLSSWKPTKPGLKRDKSTTSRARSRTAWSSSRKPPKSRRTHPPLLIKSSSGLFRMRITHGFAPSARQFPFRRSSSRGRSYCIQRSR